ncbi:hypothetical protein pEaSNUABM56_00112 [Erwinia phage pEa_SNUABM_56]|uniref:DUF3277 domain-containing protein n=1 Tax=Erwinia phage pEp_SNUABM_01 TaxID=2601643 RepID=A0A5J6DB15_9CAUD|nr:virion structural protein [Erwinia phage pEp_SNUABM_01]QEQ94911.1 DUF3277 domain-containing protein [Erwinia phage pEp_SNUABM_01]UYL84841.1 hypothetical protein pEaSNUABM55_00043 [Erwinia phage pEa_SNUABM_55]UYL85157.1 hypothetical protein pEaSNUABM56_00112 [Erwinia phage pEa_SNUABM_56]
MDTAILTPYAYDPKKVRLYLMTQRVTGFAADTKIVVARNEDNIIPHMGVDGELSAALSRNQSGVLTVSLQNTSKWNGYFSSWQKQASITGLIFFPVLLEGSQGLGLSTIGWIQRQPDLTYGTEVGQMDWEIGILDAWLSSDSLTATGFGLAGLAGIV